MKLANTTLLLLSVMLAAIVLVLASAPLTGLGQFQHDLEQQLSPASGTEPYGGCKEAARYPNTPGWKWCADRGYLD